MPDSVPDAPPVRRLIPLKTVEELTGLSEQVLRSERKLGRFPEFYQLSPARVGCYLDQVLAWIDARPVAGPDNGLSHLGGGPGRGRKTPRTRTLAETSGERTVGS
jgi:predicted DNA-binding transcriptional regulator AlpA